jgi:hypothetical protein
VFIEKKEEETSENSKAPAVQIRTREVLKLLGWGTALSRQAD